MSDWYVGQEVWIVPYDSRDRPRSATIGKIAKKWVYLEEAWHGAFSREDGTMKPARGYSPRAKAWPSREEYEAWKARDDKWIEFRRSLPHSVPEHMTDADLEAVLSLVRGDA